MVNVRPGGWQYILMFFINILWHGHACISCVLDLIKEEIAQSRVGGGKDGEGRNRETKEAAG